MASHGQHCKCETQGVRRRVVEQYCHSVAESLSKLKWEREANLHRKTTSKVEMSGCIVCGGDHGTVPC